MVKGRRRKVRSGFTMVELMAMLIIIGLLATLVVTKVASQIDKARVTTTKANLKTLHSVQDGHGSIPNGGRRADGPY